MNRRKISAMLAVALITSQVQGITFAETKVSSQEIDKVCLLYTSPSPRDTERSRMPSSA